MMTAVILAAGRGKRAGTNTPKQFLEYGGRPLIAHTVEVFQNCAAVDEILLVTSEDYIGYCREIAEKWHFRKVRDVIAGGAERYDSVYRALLACPDTDYVMIHDGARPFVTADILERAAMAAMEYGAAAVGVPSKDTVKIADGEGFIRTTPDRALVWNIQTPQAFSYALIREANEILMKNGGMEGVTDDAMIVERSGLARVRLVEGSYENVKITTPEDLRLLI